MKLLLLKVTMVDEKCICSKLNRLNQLRPKIQSKFVVQIVVTKSISAAQNSMEKFEID